jgi:hypothetical protein
MVYRVLRFVCDLCKVHSLEAANTFDACSLAREQGWRLLYLDDWTTERHICSACADGRGEAELLGLLQGGAPRDRPL